MRALATTILLVSAAAQSAAQPFLALPLDCTLGQTCFVEDYVDIDPGPDDLDYACGLKARNGHRGTDFALADLDAMARGVDVLAAADGVVEATRDGMPDQIYSRENAATVDGRECGNAVRIGHPNGLKTLYCHLAQGSIAVARGDRITTGDVLGQIGLSGQTTFPHVHFSVLQEDGSVVDPFLPGVQPDTCGTTGDTLWVDPPPYTQTGFFTAGFATEQPTLATVRNGAARAATATPRDSLAIYVYLFHAEPGDTVSFRVTGPGGASFGHETRVPSDATRQALHYSRAAPGAGWPAGQYTGQATLTRAGALIGSRQAYITVTSD